MKVSVQSNEELFSTLASIAKETGDERLSAHIIAELIMEIRDSLEELKRLSPNDHSALIKDLHPDQ